MTTPCRCQQRARDAVQRCAVPESTSRPRLTLWSAAGARRDAGRLRERLKFFVRAAVTPATSHRWLRYWNDSPFLFALASRQPAIIKKIYRSYLFHGFSRKQRMQIILTHYDFVQQRYLADLILRAAQDQVQLVEFAGRSAARYEMSLEAVLCMEREGELALQLKVEGIPLFSVAFTFVVDHGLSAIAVGCLQGGRDAGAQDRVRAATRDFFGLRPKTILMRVLQQLGVMLGCEALVLVGNDNRVMRRQIRRGKVVADYDQSWEELGATRQADGNFVLPCVPLEAPDMSLIDSSKRAQARRKHALLVQLASAASAAIGVNAGPAGAPLPACDCSFRAASPVPG